MSPQQRKANRPTRPASPPNPRKDSPIKTDLDRERPSEPGYGSQYYGGGDQADPPPPHPDPHATDDLPWT